MRNQIRTFKLFRVNRLKFDTLVACACSIFEFDTCMLLTAIATAALVAARGENLLKNGDFEGDAITWTSDLCNQGWCVLPDHSISPWTTSGQDAGRVEVDTSPWKAYSGIWSIDLNADAPYTINQKVELKPGKYVLTFHLNQNRCENDIKTGYVSMLGGERVDWFHASSESWKMIEYHFVISRPGPQTFSIGSTTSGSCGPVIDDVKLQLLSKAFYTNSQDSGNSCERRHLCDLNLIGALVVGLIAFAFGLFIQWRRSQSNQLHLPAYQPLPEKK